MKILHYCLIGAIAVMLISCCSCRKGKKEGKPFAGTTWMMIDWEGKPFKADNNYMLVFDDKEQRFGGRGECNSILGKYTLNDAAKGKIKLESIGSTRAMCPNQAQEDQFIRDLDRVDTYRIDGDLLMLLHNGELVMILEAQATEMK